MDKLVWPCQIGLKRINFFSTLNKLKLSRPGEDLLKICWHSPGMPIILMYHILTRPQTSLGWNIRAGSAASWPDSGGPSQFSRKMQEKESPKFKKKKNSKFMRISSPDLTGCIFSFLHTPFHRFVITYECGVSQVSPDSSK